MDKQNTLRLGVGSLVALACVWIGLGACGKKQCVEGKTETCPCADGTSGSQTCQSGAFGACQCSGAIAGTEPTAKPVEATAKPVEAAGEPAQGNTAPGRVLPAPMSHLTMVVPQDAKMEGAMYDPDDGSFDEIPTVLIHTAGLGTGRGQHGDFSVNGLLAGETCDLGKTLATLHSRAIRDDEIVRKEVRDNGFAVAYRGNGLYGETYFVQGCVRGLATCDAAHLPAEVDANAVVDACLTIAKASGNNAGNNAGGAPSFKVTTDEVAGIRADTRPEELAKLFPGYTITKTTEAYDGGETDLYAIKKDGKVILEFVQDFDVTVHIKSDLLVTPAGARVGAKIDKVMKVNATCDVGIDEYAKLAFCAGEPNFGYVVALDGLGTRPKVSVAVSKLAGRTIKSIQWTPEQ